MMMTDTILNTLVQTRNFLGDKTNWCQEHYMQQTVDPDGEPATSHCLVGYLRGSDTFDDDTCGFPTYQYMRWVLSRMCVPDSSTLEMYNDMHTHDEVMGFLDRCIAIRQCDLLALAPKQIEYKEAA